MQTIHRTWFTAAYSIEEGTQQKVTPEGLPSMQPNGEPELEKVTTLVLHRQTQTEQETLRIPFSQEAKKKLISDLQGSNILLARPGDVPRI